jgi:hypothetical protein
MYNCYSTLVRFLFKLQSRSSDEFCLLLRHRRWTLASLSLSILLVSLLPDDFSILFFYIWDTITCSNRRDGLMVLPNIPLFLLILLSAFRKSNDQLTHTMPLTQSHKLISNNGDFALGFFAPNSINKSFCLAYVTTTSLDHAPSCGLPIETT